MSSRAPAEGERAAVKAFEAQYRIAATRILDALEHETFLAVRMVDPTVGRVDDLVLETTTGVLGVQVKWSEYSAVLTLSNLLAHGAEAPSLFSQLADGWRRLCELHPQRPVRVTLVAHGVFNANNQAPVPDAPADAAHRHTEAFFRHAWHVADAPDTWRGALDDVRRATTLDATDFESFRQACRIETLRANELGLDASDSAPGSQFDDVRAVANVLREAVARSSSGSVVRLDREALFIALGWSDRFRTRFRHEFPLQAAYQPNVDTLARLRALLQRHASGYVALLGKPGSGKSTLLTHLMRESGWGRVVRYYVFVPAGPNDGRADALPFLGDLISALHLHGLPIRRPENTGEAKRVLADRLVDAGHAFQQRGERTLILIDGLDHAERDRGAVDNLLGSLPMPASIPNGVLIVLGSQTLSLDRLAPSVRESFDQQPDRRIEMGPLSRDAVMQLANETLHDALNAEDHAALYARTEGHALSVQMALRALQGRAEDESASDVLARIDLVDGDVLRVYRHVYACTADAPALRTLLGCIARLRDPLDLVRLMTWFGNDCVRAFRTQVAFLFRPLSPTRWTFGHDSFRLFLQENTALNGLDAFDPSLERNWHRQLAEFAAQSTDEFSHEELHHRALADDGEGVVALASAERFRAQFFLRRAPDRLGSDLVHVLREAGRRRLRTVIARTLMTQGEMNVRGAALEAIDLVRLHYAAGGADALAAIIDSGGLADYEPIKAMRLALWVAERGDHVLAQRVFEAHEPIDLLHGVTRVASRAAVDLLQSWAQVAWRFRSPSELLRMTAALRRQVGDQPYPVLTEARCLSLEVTLAMGCLRVAGPDDFNAFRDGIDTNRRAAFDDALTCRRLIQGSLGRDGLITAIRRLANDDNRAVSLTDLADRAWRHGGDPALARTLHARAEAPSLPDGYIDEAQLRRLAPECLSYWRVAAALDPEWIVSRAVPEGWHIPLRDPDDAAAMTAHFRLWARVAFAWGAALRGEQWSAERLATYLQPVWRQLVAPYQRHSSVHYAVRNNANALIDAMIGCASAHGVADAMVRAMLANTTTEPKWLLTWTLHLIESKAWDAEAPERLACCNRLLQDLAPIDSLSDHLQDLESLCQTIARLGDGISAQACLQRCLDRSFGITQDKDYHAVDLAGLVLHIARMDPANAPARVLKFAAALERAEATRAGRGHREAWTLTLHAVTLASPELALALWEHLIAKGDVPPDSLLDGLIRGLHERGETHPRLLLAAAVQVLAPLQTSGEEATARVIRDAASKLDCLEYHAALSACLRAHCDVEVVTEYLPSLDPTLRPGPSLRGTTEASLIAGDRTLTESALLDEAMHVANFAALAAVAEPGNSATPWNRAFAIAAPRATAAELTSLSSVLSRLGYPANACADVARALVAHNQSTAAITVLESALAHHSSGSWTRWLDHAPRRVLMEALVDVDPRARDRALDDFVASRTSKSRYAFHMSAPAVLDDVQFAMSLSADELWLELKAYVELLWPFQLDDVPLDVSAGTTALAADDVLVHALLTLSLQPLRRLQSRVDAALLAAAEAPKLRSTIVGCAAHRECTGDRELIRCLATIELVRGDAPVPEAVRARLSALRLHPNFSVRELVCKALDENTIAHELKPLSPVYALTLQSRPAVDAPSLYDAFEPMSDLEDDAAILDRVFAPQITELCRVAALPRANVTLRASQFMAGSGGVARHGSEAERAIVRRRSNWGLRVSHVRPRIDALRNALGCVVAELLDAERMSLPLPPALSRMLVRSNTRFVVMPATPHASGLPGHVARAGRYSTRSSDDGINPRDLRLADGRVVVAAEWSVRLGKGALHREVSLLASDFAKALLEMQPARWINRRGIRFDDYPEDDQDMPALGIVLSAGELDAEREACVGFSPTVARALGWRPAEHRLFGWCDHAGVLVAETIIWASNDSPSAPPESGSSGSAVLLTAAAWGEVCASAESGSILLAKVNSGDSVGDSIELIGRWDEAGEFFDLEPSA